ncbi:MAG TPA: protease complex subunit PrcB family protein [Vicinamibacterales bacterium]|nr:protease complex subunit PrcB family protein [Vicinamibacterales bacterium]
MGLSGLATLAKGADSHLVEPRRFVVRDPQAFAAVWSAHAGADAPPPAVDFDERMVVAVFAGQRPSAGYDVTIRGVDRAGSALVIDVDEREPDPSGVAAQVLVSPYHVVTLPRDDGEIRFATADPTGQGTIIFKPPKRRAAPATPASAEETETLVRAPVPRVARAVAMRDDADAVSSTGLTPRVAAFMAYLAGPFSGALLLATERTNAFVRFHAYQALVGLGVLGIAAVLFLILAFALLIASPTAFWVMLWLAALTAIAWVAVWAFCLVQAYQGRRWKLPLAGDYAERRAALTSLPASAAP